MYLQYCSQKCRTEIQETFGHLDNSTYSIHNMPIVSRIRFVDIALTIV